MSASTHLAAIATLIHDKTGVLPRIGAPDEASVLLIWPWQLTESAHVRNTPLRRTPGQVSPPSPALLEIRFNLVAGTAPEHLDTLARAHRALLESPILQTNAGDAHIVSTPLTVSELAALFAAAGRKLTPSSSFTLRVGA